MTSNEKVNEFLELQSKGVSIEDIASKLSMDVKALRRLLNKNGYKSSNGKYILKDMQQLELAVTINKSTTKSTVDNKKTKQPTKKTVNQEVKQTSTKKPKNTKSSQKPTKINMRVEDMDKLCEVYDWYLSIKDLKTLQPKKKSTSKDINMENLDSNTFKSTSIKVEKSTWEEFERLCSNSNYTKQEIITQALKNFLKEYKHLL